MNPSYLDGRVILAQISVFSGAVKLICYFWTLNGGSLVVKLRNGVKTQVSPLFWEVSHVINVRQTRFHFYKHRVVKMSNW